MVLPGGSRAQDLPSDRPPACMRHTYVTHPVENVTKTCQIFYCNMVAFLQTQRALGSEFSPSLESGSKGRFHEIAVGLAHFLVHLIARKAVQYQQAKQMRLHLRAGIR